MLLRAPVQWTNACHYELASQLSNSCWEKDRILLDVIFVYFVFMLIDRHSNIVIHAVRNQFLILSGGSPKVWGSWRYIEQSTYNCIYNCNCQSFIMPVAIQVVLLVILEFATITETLSACFNIIRTIAL